MFKATDGVQHAVEYWKIVEKYSSMEASTVVIEVRR